MFVEAELDSAALARGLAGALDTDVARDTDMARVAVVADTHEGWPAWVEGCEGVVELRPAHGEARLLATLFLFRDPAAVERVDDRAVMQALADRLGCAVLLPDEADTDPFNYLRFRPGSAADRVSLDPDALDEHPRASWCPAPLPPLAEVAAWLWRKRLSVDHPLTLPTSSHRNMPSPTAWS